MARPAERLIRVAFLCAFATTTLTASAQPMSQQQTEDAIGKLAWQKGPGPAVIGDKAAIALPPHSGFLPESDGSKFLELNGNLPSPGTSVLMAGDWFAVFSFAPTGYIKDDEKLDPDALMSAMKERQTASNEERGRRGLTKMYTEGWAVEPHYDPQTKYLEWGVRLRAEGSPQPIINYTVRLLGRHGYESIVLVSSPETMQQSVDALKTSLKTFEFNGGERYAEFRPGDHAAEFGLGALVLGGAAAAAVKTGLWKSILVALAAGWKLVLGAGVALFAAIGKFFKRDKTR